MSLINHNKYCKYNRKWVLAKNGVPIINYNFINYESEEDILPPPPKPPNADEYALFKYTA